MPSRPSAALTLDLAGARRLWHTRQGLAGPRTEPLDAAIARTGWVRTLGGVDAYLALRARLPHVRRADVDGAIAARTLRVSTAARGCIYVVPAAHAALALRLAADLDRPRVDRDLAKAGVAPAERSAVMDAVSGLLADGVPRATDAIRKALPPGTVRSLGDAGKKVGLSSPLPPALRLLEFEGHVERVPEGGRLDTQTYLWRQARSDPRDGGDAESVHAQVAEVFFRVAGPATDRELAAWSGLSLRDARAAIARLPLAPVAVTGHAEEAWLLEHDLPLARDLPPASTRFAFLAFEDNLLVLHGGPSPFVAPEHRGAPVESWGGGTTTLGEARHVGQRTFLAGAAIAGFWEYDAARGEVVAVPNAPLSAPEARALGAEGTALARFMADELGHARSHALDTDDAVQARANALRARV